MENWELNETLFNAARTGDLEKVRNYLAEGANINYGHWYGYIPLHIAVKGRFFKIVRFLLERADIDPNKTDKYGDTPLHAAAEDGFINIVKLLLERADIDPNKENGYGSTPLHTAVKGGFINIVKFLLERSDIDCNKTDKYMGDTPLHLAVSGGNPDIVKLFLQRADIDPSKENKNIDKNCQYFYCLFRDGETVLHIAARGGELEMVKLLLKTSNIDPNQKNTDGDTPLHIAVRDKNLSMVQLLLERGDLDPERVNKDEETVLHIAARGGELEMVKLLLKTSNIDPNQKNKNGDTILHIAARRGKLEMVKLLLKTSNIDPNQRNKDGYTVLHIAARRRELEMVKLLVKTSNIDPNQKEKTDGDTPLHIAVRYKNLSLVQLLLERGDLDPDRVNKNNLTPIDIFEADDWNLENDNRLKRAIEELLKFHALGLPAEIKALDKDSAKVFTHLLEEESYPHFESRVMLAGEQGTGKTTIARYLIGKGPTKMRKSTDGIGLYTGLSYIDRETEEWLEGKQDFSLEELTISRSLRHKPLEIPTSSLSTGLPTDLSKQYTESLIAGASVQFNKQHVEFGEKNEMQDIPVEAENDKSRSREQGNWNNPAQGIEGDRPITNVLLDVHNQQGDPNNERPVSNVHLRPVKIRDNPSDEIQVQNVHLDLQEHEDQPLDDNLIQNVPLVVDKTKCDIKGQRHVTCVQRSMPTVSQDDVLQQRDLYTSRQMASDPVSSSKQQNYSDKDTQCEEFKDKTHFENPTENESQKYKPNPGSPLVLGGTKNSSFPEDLTMHAPIEQLKHLTELSEEEQATSGLTHSLESVTDPGIITKLKRFFGVSKEVKEIKVSITEKHILKQSLKVGKKKLHQKHIAPVIIWDFGGQDIFYSTHQSFLSYRAIYLIVLDGSRALDDQCQFEQYLPGKSGPKTARDYLGFWINTIVTYCKGSQHGFPKIMIVFTHKDKIKHSEVETTREQLYGDVKSMFQGSPLMSHLVIEDRIFVNARNKNDPEMTKIKTSIIRESKLQPTWGQNLPKCFIPLELEFKNLIRKDINVITFDDLRRLNTQHPIRPLTDAELKVFLKFQHAIGKILYFDEPGLDQHVILLPTYLIDAFKSIITDKRFCKGEKQREELWDLMSQKGVISKFAIKELWRNRKYRMFEKRNDYLLAVMTHLDILVEPKRYDPNHKRIPADFYYVASMVQIKDDTGYLLSPSFSERNIGISFNSNDAIIPPALSFRFITYCLSIFDVKKYGETKDDMLFHRSAVFTIDPSLDIHILCEDERIFVRLVHARKKILIMKDLASSICECLKSAIQNISHLYIQTSSEKCDVNARSFQLNLCCSVVEDPCLLSIEEFNTIDESWICPKHKIEHEQFVLSRWITEKESEIHCELNCPVTHEAFLSEIPTALHLCRLSSLYNLDEIRELVTYLGLPYINWSDLYQFESEPEVLKFKVLRRCHDKSTLTFRQIKEAVEEGHIQTPHTLCKVMKGSSVDFETEPEKWDLVPTDKDIDKMAPLIGNKSLLYLIELGLDFCIWEDIHQRHCEMKNDLVKLNREILDKWLKFCKERNVRPTMRMIAQAYKNIGKDVKVIETTLSL